MNSSSGTISVAENTPSELLTRAEAARILGISTQTLDRERRRGKLAFVTVADKSVRIRPEDLAEYVRENRRPAGP
jgi:excisionase family DNA binding protein